MYVIVDLANIDDANNTNDAQAKEQCQDHK